MRKFLDEEISFASSHLNFESAMSLCLLEMRVTFLIFLFGCIFLLCGFCCRLNVKFVEGFCCRLKIKWSFIEISSSEGNSSLNKFFKSMLNSQLSLFCLVVFVFVLFKNCEKKMQQVNKSFSVLLSTDSFFMCDPCHKTDLVNPVNTQSIVNMIQIDKKLPTRPAWSCERLRRLFHDWKWPKTTKMTHSALSKWLLVMWNDNKLSMTGRNRCHPGHWEKNFGA